MLKLILVKPMKNYHEAVKDEMEDEFVAFKNVAPGADVALFNQQREEKERNQKEMRERMVKSVSKGILKDVKTASTKKDENDKEPHDPNALPGWGEPIKAAPQNELEDLGVPLDPNKAPKVAMGTVPQLDLKGKLTQDKQQPAPSAGKESSNTASPGKNQQTEKTISPKINTVIVEEKRTSKAVGSFGAALMGKFSLGKKK